MSAAPIAIAIGAGGVRSLAGLGVLRVLAGQGVNVSRVSGSSFGALVAAAWSLSVPGDSLVDAVGSLKVRTLLRPAWRGRGLFSHEPVRTALRSLLPDVLIEDCPIPLTVWCTDLATGSAVPCRSGPLIDALAASILFAGVFDPVRVGERLLIDGGYSTAVPPLPVLGDERGVLVDVRRPVHCAEPETSALLSLQRWRAIGAMLASSSDTLFAHQRVPPTDDRVLSLAPALGDMSILHFGAAERAVAAGSACMRSNISFLS